MLQNNLNRTLKPSTFSTMEPSKLPLSPGKPAATPPLSRRCRKRRHSPTIVSDAPLPEAAPCSAFQQSLRDIQTNAALSATVKAARIHALYAERRRVFLKEPLRPQEHHHNHHHPSPVAAFPGKGASPGCQHYQRKCWLKAKCCARFYPCRRCHDEKEDHEINRHATEEVGCVACGEVQPVNAECRACGVRFARYFCKVCRFYDEAEGKDVYHCDGCGICRVGKGLGVDYHHCDGCETCVPIADKDSHPCRLQSLDVNCPICTEYLKTSTDPVVFMRCGHAIHKECFRKHTLQAYTCPLCKKSLTDMSEYFAKLDREIAKERIPPEFAGRRSRVLCRDCDGKTVVPFHCVHHKCGACGSYNTQLLEYVESQAETLQEGLGGLGRLLSGRSAGSTVQVEETT